MKVNEEGQREAVKEERKEKAVKEKEGKRRG